MATANEENLKLFTSETGKIQMLIPIEWEYKNPSIYKYDEKAPESFGKYDKMIGAFQISCKPVNAQIAETIKNNRLDIQSSDVIPLLFVEKLVEIQKTHNYMWICAVDDHFILVTYMLDSKKHLTKRGAIEFIQVRKALATVKFIKPQYRDIVIAQNRYSLFMASIATTIELRNKAIENGSFIEYVVLSANRIDALLRLAIILTNQLENNNSEIDISILFQKKSDKPIMEKEIYKRAYDRKIINEGIYKELMSLYDERNKVVHRYIITDIRTEEVLKIASNYSQLDDKIDTLVNALEKKQHDLKIGLHTHKTPPGERLEGAVLETLKSQIRDKHGRVKWKSKDKPDS